MPTPFLRPALILTLLGALVMPGPLPVRAEPTPDEAQHFIQTLADQAIATVAAQKISDTERADRFRTLFVSAFDIPEISKFVLARYWRQATPEQQQEFIKLFEEFQVLNWSRRFKDYKGESLQVQNASQDGDHGFIVDTQLAHPPSEPMKVQWRVHPGGDGHLQITDIVVSGVSMSITQRSDYNAILQGNGGKMDDLLAALRNKIGQMKTAS